MQLDKKPNVRSLLSAATATLLCSAPQAGVLEGASVDSTALFYAEVDRIRVNEDILSLKTPVGDDEYVSLKYTFDTMTGASPNGAVKTSSAQTTTSPSGSTIHTDSGDTPTFDFRDERHALSVSWDKPLRRTLRNMISGNFSIEGDYQSVGFSDTLSLDIDQRRTTLSAGLSANFDTIEPTGGIPQGLTAIGNEDRYQSDHKLGMDAMLGITQVWNRRTLLAANVGMGSQSGYLNDPYKIISYLDNASGTVKFSNGSPYYFEKRPDERNSYSLSLLSVHQFEDDRTSLRTTYQYYSDDWDIRSHTLDLQLRHRFANGHFIEPHLRYYDQTAADFYHYYLVDGADGSARDDDITDDPTTLDYASADYRLGALTTTTLGLSYGFNIGLDGKLALRGEQIRQEDKSKRFDSLLAYALQVIFSWRF